MKSKYLVCLLVLVHLVILFNLRFTVWPEMLVMPYLQMNGFELYRDMVVPWTPGLMWLLQGWFGIWGLSVGGLKVLTWLIIGLTDALIYSIAKKKWGERAGLISLGIFVLLQPLFGGNGLWFDMAVVPLLLLAYYWRQPLFLGPAFLVKQSVVWLFPVVISGKDQILPKLKRLVLGLVGVAGGSMIWFWFRGTLGDYWWWAYDFTFRVFPGMPGHKNPGSLKVWVWALVPFFLIGVMRRMRDIKIKNRKNNIRDDPFWWTLPAILFVLPRFGLFHFQPALAFLALTMGESSKSSTSSEGGKAARGLIFISMAGYLVFSWGRLINLDWRKTERFLEPEIIQMAEKVSVETDYKKPVLLVNSPELVYVLSKRLPPKPWLTQFSWFLELPGFQEKLVDEFRAQNLRQVVVSPYQDQGKFIPGSYRPKRLLEYVESLVTDEQEVKNNEE